MAGCGSYAKIEGFAFLPVTCFTMALTTFVSQNLGAKQYDRAKKGARFGILCSVIIAELIGFVIYAAAPTLIAAFNSDPQVVHYGVMQARTIALFYFLLAFPTASRPCSAVPDTPRFRWLSCSASGVCSVSATSR